MASVIKQKLRITKVTLLYLIAVGCCSLNVFLKVKEYAKTALTVVFVLCENPKMSRDF